MTDRGRNRGFTLVEMLVVISIIVVLIAILVPTIQSARESARQTKCRTQMNTIMLAMTEYKRQFHMYPPRPTYDPTLELYIGGFSALYPDFIDSWEVLVCPDDRVILGRGEEAKDKRYSSYNGRIGIAEGVNPPAPLAWQFATDTSTGDMMITYNSGGYDVEGWDLTTPLVQGTDPLPTWLSDEGRTWKDYPRMANRYAPDYTIATHCTFHRDFYNRPGDRRDTMIRLDSKTDSIVVQDWEAPDADDVSLFMKQD